MLTQTENCAEAASLIIENPCEIGLHRKQSIREPRGWRFWSAFLIMLSGYTTAIYCNLFLAAKERSFPLWITICVIGVAYVLATQIDDRLKASSSAWIGFVCASLGGFIAISFITIDFNNAPLNLFSFQVSLIVMMIAYIHYENAVQKP